jgi:hypothetical protein
MIDLAEQAGAEFFFKKNLGCYFVWSYLHIGETGSLEEKKYEIVFVLMVLF